jgi:hypothetical protein
MVFIFWMAKKNGKFINGGLMTEGTDAPHKLKWWEEKKDLRGREKLKSFVVAGMKKVFGTQSNCLLVNKC